MILDEQQLVWARFSPVSTPFLPGSDDDDDDDDDDEVMIKKSA